MRKKTKLDTTAKYNLLKEISFKLKDTLDLDKILNLLLDTLKTIIDYDAAGIFVLSRHLVHPQFRSAKQVIAGIARRGFDQGPPEDDDMLRSGKGIIGHVIKTGESIVIPDIRLDDRYVAGRKKTLSEITLPIILHERPIGALDVESDRVNAFSPEDLETLRFFAGAAAISIEKTLLHLQILEKEKMEKQLQIAGEVQTRLLPSSSPKIEGYDIAGLCLPTYAIGGDYFDYIEIGGNKLAVVVADVSGSGIPAALLMTSFRTLLHTFARANSNPQEVMKLLNRQLSGFTRKQDFITAFYGILNLNDHSFIFINCGHNPPLLFRKGGKIEELERGGPSLNIQREPQYESSEVILEPGDCLVLYTDGVIEVFNEDQNEYGVKRLTSIIRESVKLSSHKTINSIVKSTKKFSGSDFYQDDFTLMIIKKEIC